MPPVDESPGESSVSRALGRSLDGVIWRRVREKGANEREQDPYEFDSKQWPDWHVRTGQQRSRRGRFVGAGLGLVWFYFPIREVANGHYSLAIAVACYAVLVLYAALYMYASLVGVFSPPRRRIQLVVLLYLLGCVPAVFTGDMENLTFLSYALVAAIMMFPVRASRLLGLGTIAAQVLGMWLVDGEVNFWAVFLLFMLTFMVSAFMLLVFTVSQLRAARGEIRELAVAEERERLARDLHDILGHSLTTIAVKAGLARRMLEREGGGEHPALSEVTDAEELARQALTDIRATVSNYRTASLPAEVAGARMSLQAARIRPELPHAVDNVDPKLQEVFGYVVREAVTNVIRHSGADRCEVRLGRDWVSIADNGKGPEDGGSGQDGNGLRGLRERLEPLGGELFAERGSAGFRVLARIPEGGQA